MKKQRFSPAMLQMFKKNLSENEKSIATLEKYIRDIKHFSQFAGDRPIDKALVLEYKTLLNSEYAVRSANSMLASLNAFLRFMGWYELCVKQFKVQKDAYCSESKELTKGEYMSLVKAAQKENNERLALIVQTICATGIRVSELQWITAEAAQKGEAVVSCKAKTRKVFIVASLRKLLTRYAKQQGITSGPLFVTKNGNPLNRSNIWRQMKGLCAKAGVLPEKVFPHNLRHLFARIFYNLEKDLAKLADILGHSNINTTRIYIMTTSNEHRRRMENMRLIL